MLNDDGMHNMLSQQQLRALADTINTGGGFSVKAAGDDAGTNAADAYMVGVAGQQKDFPINQPVTVEDLDTFVTDRADILSAPGMHIGGWMGENPVRASVDVSQRFPRTQSGLEGARFAAAESNQEGIGNVDVDESYVGTIDNPYYNAPAGQPEPRGMVTLFESDWASSGNVDPVARDIVLAGPNFPKIMRGRRRR
jgi:hypothetical protein